MVRGPSAEGAAVALIGFALVRAHGPQTHHRHRRRYRDSDQRFRRRRRMWRSRGGTTLSAAGSRAPRGAARHAERRVGHRPTPPRRRCGGSLTRVAQALVRRDTSPPRHCRGGSRSRRPCWPRGAERILRRCGGGSCDEAWLRSIAAFGELNTRDRRASERRGDDWVLILLALAGSISSGLPDPIRWPLREIDCASAHPPHPAIKLFKLSGASHAAGRHVPGRFEPC